MSTYSPLPILAPSITRRKHNTHEYVLQYVYMKRSIAAKKVALQVLETVGKGKNPNVAKIAIAAGYSETTAYSGNVQNTATYKEIVNKAVDKMERIRSKALDALASKDLDEERTQTLVGLVTAMTHDMQLLSGKATSTPDANSDKAVLIQIVNQLNGSVEPHSD